jgi:hypothetical protein
MSLGIAFKGPEGIVLAADSRVTITTQRQDGTIVREMPATYDNATKLLRVNGQDFVGAVTYGLGAIGATEPRTAHSFLPEFEAELSGPQRLTVEEFAQKLSDFFQKQWQEVNMPDPWTGPDMVFLVGGYDKDQPYGKVYEVVIPAKPEPVDKSALGFGMTFGGQGEYVQRLMQGYDERIPEALKNHLSLSDDQVNELRQFLRQNFMARIPMQFLPLQDCVDLAIFMIRTTIQYQNFLVDVRGVGGAIDVATITRTEGFQPIQQKKVRGEY